MAVLAVFLVFVAGLAVGLTSIGGILVVPALTSLMDLPVGRAVPASTLAFAFTGVAAFVSQRAQRRVASGVLEASSSLAPLYVAALCGSALGALTLSWLPATVVRTVIALVALTSGVHTLIAQRAARPSAPGLAVPRSSGPLAMAMLGLAVGCASAWSGTGGPVLLLPLLMLTGTPTLLALAMAQGIQLPIALSATAVNLLAGQLDVALGIGIGIVLLAGWLAGVKLGTRMPVAMLRRVLGIGLILVAVWYAAESFR